MGIDYRIVGIFFLSIFGVGCSPGLSGREKGAIEAKEAIAAGTLKLKEYPPIPYPANHQRYVALLKERCGLEYEVPELPPGVEDGDFIQEIRGWNEVMEAEVKLRHGEGIFEKLWNEAGVAQ